MPKIPIFQIQGRPTAEVGSVKSNIQIPLTQNIGTVLEPLTDFIVKKAVQENDTQNRTEALKLENEFIMEMQKVNETIVNDPVYGINKEAANIYYKEQSNNLLTKYKSQATNAASATLFNNNALGEIQKGIFRNESKINQNILVQLDNQVTLKETSLLTQAIIGPNSDFDFSVLSSDLKKLYTDAYSGKIPAPQLNKIIQNIPSLVQGFTADRDIFNNTRLAFTELNKGKKSEFYPDLKLKQRQKLIEKARGILFTEIDNEWKNYVAAAKLGKKPVPFDLDFAKKILGQKAITIMSNQLKIIDQTIINVANINSVPEVDLNSTLQTLNLEIDTKVKNKTLDFIIGENKKAYYADIVEQRTEELQKDPVKFLSNTDENIKFLIKQNSEETNKELSNQQKISLSNILIEKQKKLGPSYQVKVMTNKMSKQFVAEYKKAAKNSNGDELNSMMLGLASNYGDNEGLALQQLRSDGLPFGAIIAVGLGDSNLAEVALSFDTKQEKIEIEKYLKNKKIKITDIEQAITEGVSDFMNIVLENTPKDSTESLTKTNEIKDFLTYVTAQTMIGNSGMSQDDATQFAIDSWNQNFVLTDTYYIGKQQGDKRLNTNDTNKIQDTTDLLKTYYLDELDIVAFKSNTETDAVTLSNKMRSQMRINGEWRNTPDGEGVVFGIALDRGFAPVINSKGEQIIFKFNDKSRLVPGTDIVIDFDIGFNKPEETPVTSIINTFEKANELAREEGITYEQALEKIRKPNISNIKFDNRK